jgi:tetratricopeptide (TPR) repeat protein
MSLVRPFIPFPAAGAALLGTLVYLNALDNPFVYDDFRLIVENPALDLSTLYALVVRDVTRPVVAISYAIDTALWGRSPIGYHTTNVLLHAINVVLVFWIAFLGVADSGRGLVQRAWTAAPPPIVGFAAAALFAVHPMMTQAVGYIAARSEVAYSTFFLLAFMAGRRWMLGGGAAWWTACVGLWVVSVLTKETAAVLPLVLLAYDRLLLDAEPAARRRRWLRLELPLLALTGLAGVVRIAVLRAVEFPGDAPPDPRYVLVTVDAFWQYLGLFVLPRGQSIFHAVPLVDSPLAPRALAGLGGLVAYAGVAWALRRLHGLLPFGLGWCAVLLIPPAVLAVLGRGEPLAEHRAYLPAAGLFMASGCAFGELWARAGRWRRLVVATGIVLLAWFSVLTVARNAIWGDPVQLANEAVAHAPGHWLPRILLADALRQDGRCSEAIDAYRAAIAIRPTDEFPYTRLARCLIEVRRVAEAEQVLRQLRAVNPDSQDAALGLGVFAAAGGRVQEARAHFEEVLARQPGHPQASRMITFLDGGLPAGDRERLCTELRRLAGASFALQACHG